MVGAVMMIELPTWGTRSAQGDDFGTERTEAFDEDDSVDEQA